MCLKTYDIVLSKKKIISYHAYFIFKCCITYNVYNYNCTLTEVYIKRFFLPVPMLLRLHVVAIMSTHSGGSIIL